MQSLWEEVIKLVTSVAESLLSLFPRSPFANAIENFSPPEWLGWLNWFFPVGPCLVVMSVWLVSVSVFYLYSIIARWIKLIGD